MSGTWRCERCGGTSRSHAAGGEVHDDHVCVSMWQDDGMVTVRVDDLREVLGGSGTAHRQRAFLRLQAAVDTHG